MSAILDSGGNFKGTQKDSVIKMNTILMQYFVNIKVHAKWDFPGSPGFSLCASMAGVPVPSLEG